MDNLLSYQGNAGLGLGANSDIPVSYGKDLDVLNQSIRDVGLRDAQRNMMIFQQRVKDRDKLLEMLDSGEVKIGDTLERDMPIVNQALDKQTEAFNEWMKKGVQDRDAALAYKKATREAQQVATQAQYRKHYYDTESDLLSKEQLPKFAEARKANLEKNLSSFWADAVPYQQFNTLDVNPIVGFSKPIETILPADPNKPYEKGKRTYFSYNDALKNAQNYGLTPDGAFNLKTFHDTLQDMPPMELADKIRTTNRELARYNLERGLKPGDPDYATPIQAVPQVGPNGQLSMIGINEPLDKLAAKFSLVQHPTYQQDVFDTDKGKVDIAELKERERHNKATEGIDWGKYQLDKDKFSETTKGTEETKNAGLAFAQNLLGDMKAIGSLAIPDQSRKYKTEEEFRKNASIILTPTDVRNLTAEQLKFLGKELPIQRDADGKVIESGGLQPLKLGDDDLLQIDPDGTVKVMSGAKYNDKKGIWTGKWDNTRSTSLYNVARNVVNEENVKSGSKERNAYLPIDLKGKKGTIQVDVSGGSKTITGQTDKKTGLSLQAKDWTQEGDNWRYKDGTLYDANGKVIKE